jgi:ComF family protein
MIFAGGAVANALITALLAPTCVVCDAVLDEPLSGCVCRICWGSIRHITPPVCDACGDPVARQSPSLNPDPESLCRHCFSRRLIVDRSRAVGEYDGTLREILHALKYNGRRSLARPIAARMQAAGVELLQGADCVVPVPLHWRREYQRGFNQARELARHLQLPIVEALVRRRYTRAQVELAADRRHANVESAFALRRRAFGQPRSFEGLRIVLVDDVSTTGATLDACATILKRAGTSAVYALTAARVVTRRRLD